MRTYKITDKSQLKVGSVLLPKSSICTSYGYIIMEIREKVYTIMHRESGAKYFFLFSTVKSLFLLKAPTVKIIDVSIYDLASSEKTL